MGMNQMVQKKPYNKNPQIAISQSNYKILKDMGKKGQTFDEILTTILQRSLDNNK